MKIKYIRAKRGLTALQIKQSGRSLVDIKAGETFEVVRETNKFIYMCRIRKIGERVYKFRGRVELSEINNFEIINYGK